MNGIDALCLIIIAFNMILGMIRGAVWQVLRIASIALGAWGAMNYGEAFLASFPPSWGFSPDYGLVIAQVVLFLSIYLVVFGITHLVKALVDRVKLGTLDRALGAGLGVAKGVLFCCVLLYVQFVPLVGQFGPLRRQLYGDPVAGIERSVANDVFLGQLKDRIDALVPDDVSNAFDDHLRAVGRDVAQGR